MADRVVDPEHTTPTEDIDDVLKAVISAVLNEAADKLEAGFEVVPFTGLAVKENLFIETHPGDDVEACFLSARREVQGARGATAYAFCYDGFIETDDGVRDVLIAEGGLPGKEEGYAFGYLYDENGVEREIVYIGAAPNFMENLKLELDMEGSLDPRATFDDSAEVHTEKADGAVDPIDPAGETDPADETTQLQA